jgi:chromosome segregation ATPase
MTTDHRTRVDEALKRGEQAVREAGSIRNEMHRLESEIASYTRQRDYLAGLPAGRNAGDAAEQVAAHVAELEQEHERLSEELAKQNATIEGVEATLARLNRPEEESDGEEGSIGD